jgi:hypothetical protein
VLDAPTRFVVRPHLFSDRDTEVYEVDDGLTIAEHLAALSGLEELPPEYGKYVRVFSSEGRELEPDEWHSHIPAPGSTVGVHVTPAGGTIVLGLATWLGGMGGTAAAIGGALAVGGTLTLLGTVVATAISIGISLAVAAIFKPSQPTISSGDNSPAAYLLRNQSNQATPYSPVIRVYGRMKIAPRLVGVPRTVTRGGFSHFQAVYSCGTGPLQIEDPRAGDTPISSLRGARIEVHQNFVAGSPLTIYTEDTEVTRLDIPMVRIDHPNGQWYSSATPPNTQRVSLNFIFPSGLRNVNPDSGGIRNWHTRLVFTARDLTGGGGDSPNNVANFNVDGGYGFLGIGYHTAPDGNRYIEFVSQYERSMVATLNITFPYASQWQVSVAQTVGTVPPYQGNDIDALVWNDLQAYMGRPPINPRVPETIIEVEIPAQEQAQNTLQLFTVVATSILETFDDKGQPLGAVATRNPAWIYTDMLRGSASSRPMPASRINFRKIAAWAAACDDGRFGEPRFMCDVVIQDQTTLWEAIHIPLGCGRAAYGVHESKHSVIIDEATRVPTQLFTELNTRGMVTSRQYLDPPHGLKVLFIDPQSNWEQREAIVYEPGYNAQNATKFETLTLNGITRYSQAWRDGNYFFAQAKLRRESIAFETDVENLACTRGDLVYVAHDIVQAGGAPAYVSQVIDAQTVRLSADYGTPLLGNTGMRVRSAAGIGPIVPVTSVTADILVTSAPHNAQAGDLIVWGEVSRVVGEYLVSEIRAADDLTAQLTCVELAPAVYNADSGVIPAYTPQVSGRPTGQAFGPIYVAGLVSKWWAAQVPMYQAVLNWSPVNGAIRYDIYAQDLTGAWLPLVSTKATTYSSDARSVLSILATSFTERFRVDAVNSLGARTSGEVTLTIDRTGYPPPGRVTNLEATPRRRDILLTWDKTATASMYVVQFPGEDEVQVASDEWFLPVQRTGTHTVTVIAQDVLGQRGPVATADFKVQRPNQTRISGNAHSNTAYLRWGSLVNVPGWSVETTHALDYFEVSSAMMGPGGVFPPMPDPFPPAPPPPGSPPPIPIPADVAPLGWRMRAGTRLVNPPMAYMGAPLPPMPAPAPPPPGQNPPMPGDEIGKFKGEFLLHEESRPGDWRFYVRAVDIAGNASNIEYVDLTMRAPDNYVLLDRAENIIGLAGWLPPQNSIRLTGPKAGIYAAPICQPNQTFAEHFDTRSWASPADQVAAGYPIYIQPACGNIGLFAWEHYFVEPLGAVQITIEPAFAVIAGTPSVEVHILSKANESDPWTDPGPSSTVILPAGTRYVRAEVRVAAGPNDAGLIELQRVKYELSVEFVTDNGRVTVPAGGTAHVTFNIAFRDVRSAQVSVQGGGTARFADYLIDDNQDGMTIATFDATGLPTGGVVSWLVRGIAI